AELVFGAGARASYALERAQVVLSLDSDFLNEGPEHLKNAFGFSRGRSFDKISSSADAEKMNRLYAVESAFTATGGCADHRLRVRSSEIAGFAGALAQELAKLGIGVDGLGSVPTSYQSSDEKFLPALAKDLVAHKGQAVIVVGGQQPSAVHALALLLNRALGAFDSIVSVTRPSAGAAAAHLGSVESLAALTKELESGSVDTLVVLGANPVFASPGALGFGAALSKAKQVIHLGLYEDETGAKATWHLPMAHPLETWGDATSWNGIYSPIQPLILPLYQGRSALELFAQLAGVSAWGGRGLVEETFLSSAAGALPNSWKKTLHDGVADLGVRSAVDAGAAVVEPTNGALSALKTGGGDDLELVFVPGFTVLDGRYSNLGWLQECPDPMSKLCWDNAALLSAALAKKLGVQSGMESNLYVADVLRIELEGRSVEIPAFVLPGIEPNTIVLPLGYGRIAAGEVGNGIGVDVFPLMPADGARFARGAKVSKTGRRQAILATQDHFSVEGKPFVETETLTMGGRPLAVEGTVALYAKEPTFAQDAANLPKKLQEKSLPAAANKPLAGLQANSVDVTQQPWMYDGQAWGMTIDLTTCISCQACVVACQSENNIPVVGREGVEFGR
ncbi:MAG: hypothetical protein ACO3JL_18980, partial [Myxococcota bacterium]